MQSNYAIKKYKKLPSLHRHGFRQIARLVDIGSQGDGRVIAQKLHGDGVDNRGEVGGHGLHRDGGGHVDG